MDMDGEVLPIEIMARREDWSDGVSVYLRQRTVGHGSLIAQPVTMVPYKPGHSTVPMMTLKVQEAQQFMDELWQCGLRPSEGAGSAGALAATQKHLEDMRTLVFADKKT